MPKFNSPVEGAKTYRGYEFTPAAGANLTIYVDPSGSGTNPAAGYEWLTATMDPDGGDVILTVEASLLGGVHPEFWLFVRQSSSGQVTMNWSGAFQFSSPEDKLIPDDDGRRLHVWHGVQAPGYGQYLMQRWGDYDQSIT